ncbi:MAG: undecaprenyldiphospho-muramoylpentapeptide beta-N-acetylglucosaminyltransferase [Lachnospiraceae bacterium]|nr:undecaprenyldiphospho-muramoylpentapeptide beta-N-acetylglucosaminyltransferase [Lachnospiraceae bacterium]
MKKIVLTGGGTAGHVTPNLALIPHLRERGYEISYIGSFEGIEKKLISDFGLPYYGVSTGKFRRYFDPKNFTDPFRVLKGYGEAHKLLKQIRPDIVFSKGGFVSVPVIRAAASLKIPCIIHESDLTPGLANKLCIPVATKICCNFPETLKYIPKDKAVLTGSPVREELLVGNKEAAYELCGFHPNQPVILVMGGSQGSSAINKVVREALPRLLPDFQIVHICGKEKMDNLLLGAPGYKQFEYVRTELKDLFAIADLVISRAGANAICELLALRLPNLLIPLPAAASRGDQLLNAESFESQGYSMVLREENMDEDSLLDSLHELYFNRDSYIQAMEKSQQYNSIRTIIGLIEENVKHTEENQEENIS